MTHTAHHSIRPLAWYAVVIAAVACVSGASDARAKVIHGDLPELIVEGRAESFQVPLFNEQTVFLYCEEPPVTIDRSGGIQHVYAVVDRAIVVSSAGAEIEPGVLTVKFEKYTAHIKVGGTPDFFTFKPAYRLEHITDHQAHEGRIHEEVARRLIMEDQTREDAFESEGVRRFIRYLAQNRQLFPVLEHVRVDESAELSLMVASATWVGEKLLLTVDLGNDSSQPFRADDVVVHDRDEKSHAARVMAMFPEPDPAAEPLIAPKRDARLVVAVDDAMKGDFSAVRLEFRDAVTNRAVWVAVDEYQHRNPFMVPVSREEIARRRRARQTTVSVRGLFGGFWTTAGGDLGGLDGTTMGGFGVRVTKGFFQNLAFEVDAVGGRSGDANFSGMSWSGMTGDVVRRATFGRLQGSGVLRFGDQYVGSMRVGLGIQLASYDSTFTTGGGPMDGPGDGFEVDGVASVGGGLDVRLGKHATVGVGLAFTQLWRTGSSALEAGLHFGYGWN